MLPVKRGMCKYSELKDGSLNLADIARMNDALLVEAINERIAREGSQWRNPR